MSMRAIAVVCLTFANAVCAYASPGSIVENTVGMAAFTKDAQIFGLEKSWPSLVIYNREGKCTFRGKVDSDWDGSRLAELANRQEPQKDCALVVSAEPGSMTPLISDQRVVLLYVLDAPFCDACRLVESALRKLHAEDPEGWMIRVTRVNLTETHNPIDSSRKCAECEATKAAADTRSKLHDASGRGKQVPVNP